MSTRAPEYRLVSTRIASHVERGRTTPWINTALRTRSPQIREALARALTDGLMGEADLRERIAAEGVPGELPTGRTAAALGTVWAASPTGTADMAAGQRLLRAVVEHDPGVLNRAQQQIYAQVSFVTGAFDDVTRALGTLTNLPRDIAESLRTDLLNPAGGGQGTRTEWLAQLTAPFTREGLVPIDVRPDQDTIFDGLTAQTPSRVDGPLVSVIMPCYRPDAALVTSVASIVAQSYENLEVILIDDASGPEFHESFEEACAMDSRIRLLRMPENGGTYRGRNAAMQQARGTFVTVQDADDWSHPQRIADQVALLESSPAAGGSTSDAIRATDDLLHQWIGYPARRRNASSLMFRHSVLERTGPFDLVRKSGDSEFHERLTTLVGPVLDTRTPLAITRLRGGTLSRADFAYQWMAPDRLLYRAAYRSWHRTLGDVDTPHVPSIGGEERVFPAPAAMLRSLPGQRERGLLDLLVVADTSDPAAVRDIVALESSALRVGVVHLEDPTRGLPRRPEPDEDLLDQARRGVLEIVSPTDDVEATTTLVLSPGALELLPSPAPRIRTGRVVVTVRPPHTTSDVTDLVTVGDESLTVLGSRPTWAAATIDDQRVWAHEGWDLPLVATLIKPRSNGEVG